MAGRVAGAMKDFERVLAERDGIAFAEKAVGHAIAHRIGDAVVFRLFLEIGKQRTVGLMRADDLDAERLLQLHGAAGMVDMTMRDPDRAGVDRIVLEHRQHLLDVAARIDDDAMSVVHVKEDGAVLLEGRDRHDAGVELTHDRPFAVSPLM